MTFWRKYSFVGLISARSNLAYFGDVVSRVLFLGVVLYIFLRLWKVTYAETAVQTLGGLTITQMLWYLTVTESITLSAPRVAQVVDEDVRTGSLATQLVRPLSYPLYRLWTTLGERLVRFFMNVSVGSLIAWILVGALPVSAVGLLIFVLALPLAFVLDFWANFLIGLGAFWLEDTSGLLLLYSRITMILGGMLIPLELFPRAMQPVLRALPFSSMVYGPAHLLVLPSLNELIELVLRQGTAIVVIVLFVGIVYRTALRRVYANGG